MKATRWTMKTLIAFFTVIGVAMIVCAAGIVVSNAFHIPTHVTEGAVLTQASVNTVGQGGVEHIDLTATVSKGITYDTGIRVQSVNALGSVYLNFTITKTVINASDLVLQYYNGANWISIPLIDLGTHLVGNYGPINVVASFDTTYSFLLTFAVTGDYDTTVQLVTA